MMEAVRASEPSVNIYLITRLYIPQDSKLHIRRLENLKSQRVSNSLQSYDIAQNCAVLLIVVKRLSQHNLKMFHHRHI
jgi:hypothetical protein